MGAYESAFGARSKDTYTTWIVECPITAGCFTNLNATTAELLGEEKEPLSAETVSPDTLMVDLSGGMPKLVAAATPSLAASWLGYAHNPGSTNRNLPYPHFRPSPQRLGGKPHWDRTPVRKRFAAL